MADAWPPEPQRGSTPIPSAVDPLTVEQVWRRESGVESARATLKTVVAAMSPWVQIPHPPQAKGP
ncbi:hypothetical protein GCM10010446_50560 [Streptomyces enissocaesilis]|uniref:Uncharacterized protein n=1 Tax=Streptomyces enissocaesilis TaxID=332589 RepID=A0ABN3XL15_9ACTN